MLVAMRSFWRCNRRPRRKLANFDGTVDMGAYESQQQVVVTCYRDNDGDNYGDPNISQTFCAVCGPGYVLTSGDCNDENMNVYPNNPEICDEQDNDCDELVDEGFDQDGDGFTICVGDCDDENPNINPDAAEVCGNNVDDNCNGAVDEGCCYLTVELPACRTVYVGYTPAASTTLTHTVTGDNGSPTYAWSNGETTASITVSPSSNTTYIVTVTSGANCTATATTLVESVDVRCGNNNDKVQVCHGNSNTLCISQSAVAAHLAHGDALGACGLQVCQPYQPAGYQMEGHDDLNMAIAESLDYRQLKMYPNPATDKITVVLTLENSLSSNLIIENSLGQVLLSTDIEPGTTRLDIDISQLRSGIYFLKEKSGAAVRFVKH
ncbi:MAG: T9SS type A sorting domain-containing protein [Saprospiraceae bacterium]|nr:T9SS type A sorting domain-containing protein [Saprospiraceae bacterium]